jgi:hypothetical protein
MDKKSKACIRKPLSIGMRILAGRMLQQLAKGFGLIGGYVIRSA